MSHKIPDRCKAARRKEARGFAFSFDAFVAFILSMTVIATLIVFVNIPSGYYEEFEQLYLIGQDTINTMGTAGYSADQTYMARFAEDLQGNPTSCTACCGTLRNFIPIQYAFRLEQYNNASRTWDSVCERRRMDLPSQPSCSEYNKMRAALPFVITEYGVEPDNGGWQYGYGVCNGEFTPCATPESAFDPGTVQNKLLRLVICV